MIYSISKDGGEYSCTRLNNLNLRFAATACYKFPQCKFANEIEYAKGNLNVNEPIMKISCIGIPD